MMLAAPSGPITAISAVGHAITISAPRCFEIEKRLKEELDIPVFHDDQHGTAIVVAAGLLNALKFVGKKMEDANIVINGA